MKRRGFLRGLAALAALAVAPTLPAVQVNAERARFLEMAATGVVKNQMFYLDGPLVFEDIRNLLITQCTFFFPDELDVDNVVTIDERCTGLVITHCTFVRKSFSQKALS